MPTRPASGPSRNLLVSDVPHGYIRVGQWVRFVCCGCTPGGHTGEDYCGYGRVQRVGGGVVTVTYRGREHQLWYPDHPNSKDHVSEMGLAEAALSELGQ